MNKHRFTKGDWRVCGGFTPEYSAITSKDGYIIFGMADRTSHKERGKLIKAPDYQTQRLNLKLIAAAPKLLLALEEFLSMSKSYGWDELPECRGSLLQDAQEAIQEALGEK